MTAGRETQEAGTDRNKALEAMLADLEKYADEAFNAGHFPNPIGHSFVGCTVCRIARAARVILEAADCLAAGSSPEANQ